MAALENVCEAVPWVHCRRRPGISWQTMVRVFRSPDMLSSPRLNEPDGFLLSRPARRRLYASMRTSAGFTGTGMASQWPPLRSKVRSSFSWPLPDFWIKISFAAGSFPPPWKWAREMKRLRFGSSFWWLLGGPAGVRLLMTRGCSQGRLAVGHRSARRISSESARRGT